MHYPPCSGKFITAIQLEPNGISSRDLIASWMCRLRC